MDSHYEKKIEDLMQENYHLKTLVEEYRSKEEWYKEELEQATSQSIARKSDREFKLRESELKEKINSLRLELELTQQSEKSYQDKITELEKLIVENQQSLPELNGTKIDCDETQIGQSKEEQIAQLQDEISSLKSQIRTDKAETMALKLEVDTLKNIKAAMTDELQSVKIECTSYCNLLEKARQENLELNSQLDMLLMQQEEQSHEKKGNSLFSELDDRRVEAEKTLMSQKKSFELMKKKTEVLKQHNQRLKMQLFAAMGRGNDNSDRVEALEAQLEQERMERRGLMEKIQQLEDNKADQKIMDRLKGFSENVSKTDKSIDKDYMDYLLNMLKSKEDENQELSRKLHIQNMCLLDQKNKVSEKEKLLYAAEVKKDEMCRKYQQMKMERDELEMELKPELKSTKKPVGKTEKIPTGYESIQDKNISVFRENTSENEQREADATWVLDMIKKWDEEEQIKDEPKARTVRMSNDVDVFDADGQINIVALRDSENDRKLVREKPAAGKVTVCTNKASEPKYKVDDCNTQ